MGLLESPFRQTPFVRPAAAFHRARLRDDANKFTRELKAAADGNISLPGMGIVAGTDESGLLIRKNIYDGETTSCEAMAKSLSHPLHNCGTAGVRSLLAADQQSLEPIPAMWGWCKHKHKTEHPERHEKSWGN